MKELIIDLSQPPDKRWKALKEYQKGFDALLNFFSGEIKAMAPSEYIPMLYLYAENYLSKEHRTELIAIAKQMDLPLEDVLVGNLYYDALKIVLGCSAFAVSNSNGPIHGRNLDWYSNDYDLSKYSLVTRYVNGANEYITVGWPGFTGCLSGMALGKFSITLNAVWSNDPFSVAEPVVYLIRKTLERAESFQQAVNWLEKTPIASDCLLLVCGTTDAEIAVVERTPRRAKVRYAENGKIVVTNDYKLIDAEENLGVEAIMDSSCGRYNRVSDLLRTEDLINAKHVGRILSDSEVRMGITMQQMYFNPKNGTYKLF